jgi:hypothetical protein
MRSEQLRKDLSSFVLFTRKKRCFTRPWLHHRGSTAWSARIFSFVSAVALMISPSFLVITMSL